MIAVTDCRKCHTLDHLRVVLRETEDRLKLGGGLWHYLAVLASSGLSGLWLSGNTGPLALWTFWDGRAALIRKRNVSNQSKKKALRGTADPAQWCAVSPYASWGLAIKHHCCLCFFIFEKQNPAAAADTLYVHQRTFSLVSAREISMSSQQIGGHALGMDCVL